MVAVSALKRWRTLVAYLKAKLAERDWHGVRDAAADLEVLEAKHPHLRRLK